MASSGYYILLLVTAVAVCVCATDIPSTGVPRRCFLAPDPGNCRAYVPSFYYDPLTGACDCFVYGGCQGNENRFSTLQECMDGCVVQPRLQKNTAACDTILQEHNPLATVLDIIQGSQQQQQPPPQPQSQPSEPQPHDLQQTLVLGTQPQQPLPQVLQPQLPFPQTLQPQRPLPQVLQPQLPFPQTLQPQLPFPQTLQPQLPFPQTLQPQQPRPQVRPPQQLPAVTSEEEVRVGYHYPVPSVVFTSSGLSHGTLFLGQPVLVPVRRGTDDDDDDRPSC